MKNLKKILPLSAAVLFLASLTTSCGSYHSGCPGKDRPSYRAYGMTEPAMKNFNTVKEVKAEDTICLSEENSEI